MDIFNYKPFSISFLADDSDEFPQFEENDYIEYSLYDLDGEIVAGIDGDQVDVSEISDKALISITIPAEANVIDEGEVFANRVLVINYSIAGVEKSKRISYRVIPFVPYTCSKEDVRHLFGLSSTIIEDDMIDLYSAYLKCKSLMDDEYVLDAALKSYGAESVKANRAIVICSALTFRNSLMLLTPKIETDSVVSQTRFTMSADDFAKLFDNLEQELEDLLSELLEEDISDRFSPDLFVVGNLTDTFTGG